MKNINDKTKILKKLGSVVGMSVMLIAPIAIVTTNLNNNQTTSLTAVSQTVATNYNYVSGNIGTDFTLPNESGKGSITYTILSPSAVRVKKGSDLGGDVCIPSSVTTYYDSDHTRISGTYQVVSIGEKAFQGQSGMTSVTIPDTVGIIDFYAFDRCLGLTSIIIPNSVREIQTSALRYCDNLASIIIGTGTTIIGQYAFDDCKNLIDMTINAVTPPCLGCYALNDIHPDCKFHVPASALDTYKSSSDWAKYADHIVAIE